MYRGKESATRRNLLRREIFRNRFQHLEHNQYIEREREREKREMSGSQSQRSM